MEEARRKGVDAIAFDLNSGAPLPYPDASFDVVVCIETLEHVLPTDRLLAEIRRVMKPGGIGIIDVPRLDSFLNVGLLLLGYQPPGIECSRERRYGSINRDSVLTGHVAYFTRRALHEMLETAGFRILDARQVGQRSGWLRLQESEGRRVGLGVRLAWWIYDLPLAQEGIPGREGAEDGVTGSRRPAAIALPLLVAAAAAVFGFDLLTGHALVGFTNFDLFAEFLPRHAYTGAALRRGEIPLWDPHQIAGLPFLATLQGGVLYPPNALYALLPTGLAMGLLGFASPRAGRHRHVRALPRARQQPGRRRSGSRRLHAGRLRALRHLPPQRDQRAALAPARARLRGAARAHGRPAAGARARRRAGACSSWRDATTRFVMTAQLVAAFGLCQAVWMLRDGRGSAGCGAIPGRAGPGGGGGGGAGRAAVAADPRAVRAQHAPVGRPGDGLARALRPALSRLSSWPTW